MEAVNRFTFTPAWLAALFSAAVVVLALPLGGTASGCRGVEHDPEAILDAFEKMHSSIYQVYRLTDPGEVFDLLSKSLEGEELEKQVYEYLKCLKVQTEFNTRISIAEVFYNDLVCAQRPRYAAHLWHDDTHVLSVSPEKFFTVAGRTIETQPMKGTAPRGRTME